MFRSLLSCASIFVLLVSTLLSPMSVSARRCGEKMPITLLSLYRNSQFIYIGTLDRIEEGEITEETADYTLVPIKKSFSLSTALKGETKKMLVLEQSEYRYKARPMVEEAEVENQSESTEDASAEATEPPDNALAVEAGDEVDDTELKPGDRVLLFLNKNEDSDELDLADYSDGLKKMTSEKLSAYQPRIRELNEIFSKAEPSYSEIVAWLVRCAEDPETRWEGTYELLQSFRYLDWSVERAKLAQQKAQAEDDQPDSERYLPQPPKQFDTGDENFAKELTEGQKLLLTNMMLSRTRPKPNQGYSSEDTSGMNRGDRELIDLVKRWGDSKVAINILDQIRYDSSDPDLNADLMESFASIMNDDELIKLAERYSSIQWRNEEDEIDAEDKEQKSDTVDKDQSATEAESSNDKTVDVPDEEFTEDAASEQANGSDNANAPVVVVRPKNEPKKKTYGELRAELFNTFLDRADRLIAKREKGGEH